MSLIFCMLCLTSLKTRVVSTGKCQLLDMYILGTDNGDHLLKMLYSIRVFYVARKIISFFSNDVTELVVQMVFSFLARNITQRMYGFQMLLRFSKKHLRKQKMLLCLETVVYL